MSNNKLKSTLDTIKPQEEVIGAVETVITEIPAPLIPEIVQEPILDVSTAESTSVGSIALETETKLAKEKRFAKIALCLGVVVLVIMIINKK